MNCPYCNKEFVNNGEYCPYCGQKTLKEKVSGEVSGFWNDVLENREKSYREYSEALNIQARAILRNNRKKMIIIVSILLIILVGIVGEIFLLKIQTKNTEQLKLDLIGKTMTCSTNHWSGFSRYYDYYQITFMDENNVIYATGDSKEELELEENKTDTTYSLKHLRGRKYSIGINGKYFTLYVDSNHMPDSISTKD